MMDLDILPRGFVGGALSAGLKKSGKPDLGLIYSELPCSGAGVFTRNKFTGANIPVCRRSLSEAPLHGVVVHSGQANVCTGARGIAVAEATVAKAAELLEIDSHAFILGSTGVIGVLPDQDKLEAGIDQVIERGMSSEKLLDVATAMMTTDLVKKISSRTVTVNGTEVRLLGFAKGSGMIHPNMGTMLCYLMTDATIAQSTLDSVLRNSVDESFNCLTVDGDTSTSDMTVVLANGASGCSEIRAGSREFDDFSKAIAEVCRELAMKIAQDGEGATKLVTIQVSGADTIGDARKAGLAVGNSNLVKTAIFGKDPNWGRLACAVGYSGAEFEPEQVEIKLQSTLIFQGNEPADHDKPALVLSMKDSDDILIEIDLGAGNSSATIWTCDLSYDYVRINAEYTT